jgi:hypothetical protein
MERLDADRAAKEAAAAEAKIKAQQREEELLIIKK